MFKLFFFFIFFCFSAHAADRITVLPEPTDPAAPYTAFRKPYNNSAPFADYLNSLILKQKNANILIARGFPMPFDVADVNAANQELLAAYAKGRSNASSEEIRKLFFRFIQCYPDKKICMENIPDDLSKYLTLSEAEKNILPAAQKSVPALPVPPLPENSSIQEKQLFYDRILLNRLKEKAGEALDRGTSHSFDNSVLHQTLTAGDAMRRQYEEYQNFLPAVHINKIKNTVDIDENIMETEIAIREVLSTLPMDINRSALCLSIRNDKPFEQNKQKISYTAPDSTTYTFETAGRRTDDDQFYFISINGTRQDDERISERFLWHLPSMSGFFEYKNHIFLTMSLGQAEKRIFQFDPSVYAFLPVCMLNKDMTVFHIDATEENIPLCRRVTRKEYNVYPKKPLSQGLNAAQLQAFFKLQCPPENKTCVTEEMYNFRDRTGVFADYDNDGKNDILHDRDQRLFVYLPEQQKSTLLLETPGEEQQQIVQIDNQNYLLTTKEYKLNDPKKTLYETDTLWQSVPKDLYKIANGKAPERICSFTPAGEYY